MSNLGSNFGSSVHVDLGKSTVGGLPPLKAAKDHVKVVIDADSACGGKFESKEDAWKLFGIITQFSAHELPITVVFPRDHSAAGTSVKVRLEFVQALSEATKTVNGQLTWANLLERTIGELIPEWKR